MNKTIVLMLLALSISACDKDIDITKTKNYESGYEVGFNDGYDSGLEDQYARICNEIEKKLNSAARDAVCR